MLAPLTTNSDGQDAIEGNMMSSTNLTQDINTAVAEKWAEVVGDSIPYLTAGDSERKVLLVHGAGSSRKTWTEVMPSLSGDNRLFAPDLMGFGDAPRGDFVHTPEYMAEHLVGFMDAVGVERAALVGHSLGARVCLEVALRHPERVSRLALEAPMGFGKISWRGRSFSMARWWLHKLLGLKSPYPKLRFPTEGMDSSAFESLSCETLLLWGTRDPYFPLEQSRVALEVIPRARLAVYARVGHSLHRSDPARFSKDVGAFLAERV